MKEKRIEIGTIVQHPKLGPGKVLAVRGGGNVVIYFRDIVESSAGDAIKTIATSVIPLEIPPVQADPMLDNLPPYSNGRFQGIKKPRLSLDHAITAFLNVHPKGFDDPLYLREERSYKIHAHEMWMDGFGGGQGAKLLDDGNIAEVRRRLLQIDAKLNLLSPYEKAAFKEALDDDCIAKPFFQALFEVVSQSTPDRTSYQLLIDAVDRLPQRDGGTRVATWPVLTQFPFIACPEHHILLKPEVVKDCAARFSFDLHYSPELNWRTYGKLLELAEILLEKLQPFGARDLIDVQSFMWIIGGM